MPGDLENMKAIVTGGNLGGIGGVIVEALVKDGCDVLFTYRDIGKSSAAIRYASELSQKYAGRSVKSCLMDITKDDDQRTMLKVASDFFQSTPDILVNNAGIIDRSDFIHASEKNVRKVLNTNLLGLYFLTQKVAKLWIETEQKKKYSIINIGSISADVPTGMAIYEVSKAGVEMLTKSLALELPSYITCNVIKPGLFTTKLNEERQGTRAWNESVKAIPQGTPGPLEEIGWIVKLMVLSRFMNGSSVVIDGGRSINFLGTAVQQLPLRAKL